MNSLDSTPEPDPLDPREAAAAELLGVSVSTVRRTKDKPAVQRRIRQLRLEAVAAYAGRLTTAARDAVERLVALSQSGTRDDAVRLRASVAIIELSLQGVALEDLQAELAELRAVIDRVEGRVEDENDRSGPGEVEPPPDDPNGPPPLMPADAQPDAPPDPGDSEPA
jgi:hypothetical protein